jgi:hypothetical protein
MLLTTLVTRPATARKRFLNLNSNMNGRFKTISFEKQRSQSASRSKVSLWKFSHQKIKKICSVTKNLCSQDLHNCLSMSKP